MCHRRGSLRATVVLFPEPAASNLEQHSSSPSAPASGAICKEEEEEGDTNMYTGRRRRGTHRCIYCALTLECIQTCGRCACALSGSGAVALLIWAGLLRPCPSSAVGYSAVKVAVPPPEVEGASGAAQQGSLRWSGSDPSSRPRSGVRSHVHLRHWLTYFVYWNSYAAAHYTYVP
jgi:hypothetical protein